MWRYVVPVGLFGILAVFLGLGLFQEKGIIESPLIGKPMPEFSLPGLQNPEDPLTTSDFAGQFSLINVWGTWCVECQHEHEYLLELAATSIPIYGFNYKDDRDKALRWLEVLGNPYTKTGADDVGRVAIDFGVYGAPETFLIGPDLTILEKRVGVMTPEIWERDFLPAIEAHRAQQ